MELLNLEANMSGIRLLISTRKSLQRGRMRQESVEGAGFMKLFSFERGVKWKQ